MRAALVAGAAVLLLALAAVYLYSKSKSAAPPKPPPPKPPQTPPQTKPPQTPPPQTQPPQTQTQTKPPPQTQTKPPPQTQPQAAPANVNPLPDVASSKDTPDSGSNASVLNNNASQGLEIQTFSKPGLWSYVPSEKTTKVRVSVLGGGGGGGNGARNVQYDPTYAQPGHVGQLVQQIVDVSPGIPVPVYVGNGGSGVTGSTGTGGVGEASYFGTVKAAGGAGGAPTGGPWPEGARDYKGPNIEGAFIDNAQVGWPGQNCDDGVFRGSWSDCLAAMTPRGAGAGGGRLDNWGWGGCGDGGRVCNSVSGAGAPGLVRVEPRA
jgi:hypothetical protein